MAAFWVILVLYLLVINRVTLGQFISDKEKAKRGLWRIPERRLLGLAFAGGGIGALIGMVGFRHKTNHLQFRILVPLSIVLWVVLLLALAFFTAQS